MKHIIDFIDNEDFAKANVDKDFTLEEKVSLVVHNYSVSLEDKYEYLLSLDYTGNSNLQK